MTYQFGDRVKHPEYEECLYVCDCSDAGKAVVLSKIDGLHEVKTDHLFPDDPHIRQIDGKWYRVFGPLDTEAAKKYVGEMVLVPDALNGTWEQSDRLVEIKGRGVYVYKTSISGYCFIAVPMDPKPAYHDAFQPAMDLIMQAYDLLKEAGK